MRYGCQRYLGLRIPSVVCHSIFASSPSARSEGDCFLWAYFMQADRTLAHLSEGDRTSIADCVHVAGSQTVCAPTQLRWSTEGSGCSATPPHDLDFFVSPNEWRFYTQDYVASPSRSHALRAFAQLCVFRKM